MDKRVTLTSLLSNKTYSHTHTQSYMQCDTMSMKNLTHTQSYMQCDIMSMKNLVGRSGVQDKSDTMSMKNLVGRSGVQDKIDHTLVSQVTFTR